MESRQKGKFSVKSFYEVVTGDYSLLSTEGYVWCIPLPSRVLAFCWVARLHKVLTIDMFQWRHHTLVNGCFLCLQAAEDIHHLFNHHPYSVCLWNAIVWRFVIDWVMPQTIKDLHDQWRFYYRYYRGKILWKLALVAVLRICVLLGSSGTDELSKIVAKIIRQSGHCCL